jgi:cobyrinic acid a,c-diamide synthase
MTAFVIAGTHSGVGKTTVTLSILAALCRRGLRVQAYKVGPDFIDPGHHSAISGIPSRTLDGWMLSREYNQHTFEQNLQGKDVGIVEGVMGLFDGYDGKSEAGSTAEMAKWLGVPVILVVDASAMARSVAALVQGFRTFDQNLNVAGVIFNRIAGSGHLLYLRDALENVPGMTVLGGLPHNENIVIPERHLGLVTPAEHDLTPKRIEQLASFCEDNLDLEWMLRMSKVQSLKSKVKKSGNDDLRLWTLDLGLRPRVRFGVARDEAFCFYYPDNLELLEQAGAELVFFSPLHDSSLPPNVQGLYLGGGYPEVHAETLAANSMMRQEIAAFIDQGGVVYAECGGFMYLTSGIRDSHGRLFPMVGIYPTVARMLPRLAALGYVEVEVERANTLAATGQVRGHEFHYSELEQKDFCGDTIEPVYHLRKGHGEAPRSEGYLYKRCLASYVHLHFGSNPQVATSLVYAARQGISA